MGTLFSIPFIGTRGALTLFDVAEEVTGFPIGNADLPQMWKRAAIQGIDAGSGAARIDFWHFFTAGVAGQDLVSGIINLDRLNFTPSSTNGYDITYRVRVLEGAPNDRNATGDVVTWDSGILTASLGPPLDGSNTRVSVNLLAFIPAQAAGLKSVLFNVYFSNTPFAELQAVMSRYLFSSSYVPTFCADYGSSVSYEDLTLKHDTESGANLYGPEKKIKRSLRLNLNKVERTEFFTEFVQKVVLTSGRARDFLTVMDDSSQELMSYQSVWGSFKDPEISGVYHSWQRFNTAVVIEESI